MSILDNKSFQIAIAAAVFVGLLGAMFWAGFWMTFALSLPRLISMVMS